jgi:hypothetical protein
MRTALTAFLAHLLGGASSPRGYGKSDWEGRPPIAARFLGDDRVMTTPSLPAPWSVDESLRGGFTQESRHHGCWRGISAVSRPRE